mmetsp:Transcript_82791/g.208449  ORF Transcript_82791/g.208449 Transcript_82791/m.208449 type:complete len:239 (-) Transcript_82791:126-842(-)
MLCGEYISRDPEATLRGEGVPLLPFPGPEASQEQWASVFPIDELPPLSSRAFGFYAEPWCGVGVVSLMSLLLVSLTTDAASEAGSDAQKAGSVYHVVVPLIWTWAAVAFACVAYLLCGDNGEVKRTARTCYPIPPQIARFLMSSDSMDGMSNVTGPDGRTYCVRCLVWRPKEGEGGVGHHCSTCQRCVTGFDHHCGVFGRCITSRNMPCFYTLIAMLLTGVLTTGAALSMQAPQEVAP